jgi:peptidoglycan/xylan/chitin deacetylase (PgdA/CDA1 family)
MLYRYPVSELRFDRLTTVHLCWPIARLFAGSRAGHIPILMYHAVQDGSSHPNPYYETNVSPQVFAAHIRQLREEGFRGVSLGDAIDALKSGTFDKKLIVITFDDGYRDFYETAFPILSENSFTATVFLMTAFVGDAANTFKGKQCLTWPQVRELAAQGVHFGSHTATHPQLRMLPMERVEEELSTSKQAIEDHLGTAIQSFSYPYAFPEPDREFKRRLRDLLIRNGYKNGVTTVLGTATDHSDAYFLPRLPVNTIDDSLFFQAKLEGAYNWVHGPQYLSKLAGKVCSHLLQRSQTAIG